MKGYEMTFEERIKLELVGNGLFDSQADEVLSLAKNEKTLDSMKDVWQKDVDQYPESVLVTTWITVKCVALDWIDTNLPQAFFRPLFAD